MQKPKTTAIEKKQKTETAPAVKGRSVLSALAARYAVEPAKVLETLKNTVFKDATDSQLVALCIVANQYGLNPFLKEIYAFPDKKGGIIPVVGIDGWARMINDHEQNDGMEIEGDSESCTVTIYRKDRSRPTMVTEYLSEVRRDTAPWHSHPLRMLRHKAVVQCARLAFGYTGIKDPDEAERIVEAQTSETRPPVAMPRLIQVASDPGLRDHDQSGVASNPDEEDDLPYVEDES